MKLVLQRVARASVEIDGYVQSRVGSGIVVFVGIKASDTVEKAQHLATKLTKQKLWSELGNTEKKWSTNVMENGFEVLVVLQQSLLVTFEKATPNESCAIGVLKAKPVYEAFVKRLQEEYQDEMIVTAATASDDIRIDMTTDGPGMFDLDSEELVVHAKQAKAAVLAAQEKSMLNGHIEPDVESVTDALRRIPLLPEDKATLESSRIFRAFGLKKFRAALSEAAQTEADIFAEVLDTAGHVFTKKQQEQITAWLGLDISAPAREIAAEQAELEDHLDKQLAALETDVGGVVWPRPNTAVKAEDLQNDKTVARVKPDWKGRAAPTTPGAPGRPWSQDAQRGNKGKGKGLRAAHGILSLDASARIHGLASRDFGSGQLQRFSERDMLGAKEEVENSGDRKRQRFVKGTPTVAPMTPAPKDVSDEL